MDSLRRNIELEFVASHFLVVRGHAFAVTLGRFRNPYEDPRTTMYEGPIDEDF